MPTASGGSPHPRRPAEGAEPGGRHPAVRASDAEREQTVVLLQRGVGEGRLDLDEADTRMAAAYAARYRHELSALLDDLPDDGGTDRAPSPTGRAAVAAVALTLGLGLLSGVTIGGLGVLAGQAGHHHVVERSDGVGPGHSPHHPVPGNGVPVPESFWHPPREV